MASISLTFNFDSLEEAVQMLGGLTTRAGVAPQKAEAPKAAPAPADAPGQRTAKAGAAPGKTADAPTPAAVSAATKPQASTAATEGNAAAGASTQEAPGASSASSGEPVAYEDLQRKVYELVNLDRAEAAKLVQTFGVRTFKDLPEGKWPAAYKAVVGKLNELQGD